MRRFFIDMDSATPMRQTDAEVDRYLTLLRNRIRQQGFTQLEVQQALGWGRSYISQLLTKKKCLRLEQVLLILKVIGIEPVEFFRELYGQPGAPYAASRAAQRPVEPRQADEQQREFQELRAQLHGLVGLLLRKKLITSRDLRAAAVAAEQEP